MKSQLSFQSFCSDVEYVMSVYILSAIARLMANLSIKSVVKVLQEGMRNSLA